MATRYAFVIAALAIILPGMASVAVASDPATPAHPARDTAATLNSPAMNAMLRADRDKDGLLSRDELDQYDLTLGRRFKEADVDGDGKLTLYELETILPSEAVGATR